MQQKLASLKFMDPFNCLAVFLCSNSNFRLKIFILASCSFALQSISCCKTLILISVISVSVSSFIDFRDISFAGFSFLLKKLFCSKMEVLTTLLLLASSSFTLEMLTLASAFFSEKNVVDFFGVESCWSIAS